ncbi:hypothetical protein VE03_07669 [Pseudogymnoascus sp. 23342-1-I1]|nr:hypothetical protein VE03_07669 [Pseudogymnoascus sp. 23342-1-I1]
MAPGHPKPPSRAPLVIAAFGGAAAIFIGLKWRAVFARSEAAKERSGAGGGNVYTVQTGRSGGGI